MASVKIDLGFNEQAVLSERSSAGLPSAKHQRDAEEFLRRWPRTRSIEQESGYLRQLGLHLGQTPPGVNSSDASAQLRAAVKSGKVMVVIERAAPTGGGISGSGPTTPPYPLAMREKAARVAPTRTPSRSYQPPRYDDVSAGDLIAYLEDFVSRTSGDAAAPAVDSSTLLSGAQPFEYGEDSPLGDVQDIAARGVSEADEGECYEEYERDMDLCNALGGPMGGARGLALCQQNAFAKYQQCRGF
jgi:hypothetical protein